MMNVFISKSLTVAIWIGIAPAGHCLPWIDSMNLGVGSSLDSELLTRIGIQHHFRHRWWESDTGSLSPYLDLSYNHWSLHHDDDLQIMAMSPVFSYQFSGHFAGGQPVVELGIGLSYISARFFSGRDMGGSFQFEDRIAAGLKYDIGYLSLIYLHYSNGGLYSQNAGLNSVLLNFRYVW